MTFKVNSLLPILRSPDTSSEPEPKRRCEEIETVAKTDVLPDEIMFKIFDCLTEKQLSQVALVNKRFQVLSEDWRFWEVSKLPYRFPWIKNVFIRTIWNDLRISSNDFGLSFEVTNPVDAKASALSAKAAVKDIYRLKVEGDVGYTIITMPRDFTIDKLKTIIADFVKNNKFPSAFEQETPGFRYFWDKVSPRIGGVAVAESYTFAISNSILTASRYTSYEVQKTLVNDVNGCELPQGLEAMTLLFLTYVASGEKQERLCSQTCMGCLEQINNYSLVVGGFALDGLEVYGGGCSEGAGVVRKFL